MKVSLEGVSAMRVETVSLATLVVLLLHVAAGADDATPVPAEGCATSATDLKPIADPIILLIRDETVRAELKFSDNQRRAIDDLLKTHNRLLLAIRDVSPSGADETARPALTELRQQFAKVLSDEQRTRLTSLILQAQGYDSLLRNDVSTKLALAEKQQRDLTAAARRFSYSGARTRKSSAGSTPEQLQEGLARLQKDRQQQVLAVLNEKQTAQYAAMLGEPFDFAKVKASPADAPEFDGVDAWMNSESDHHGVASRSGGGCALLCLRLHQLRSQLSMVQRLVRMLAKQRRCHHWDPHAGDRERSQKRTPKASLETHGLKFPVAVDKEKKMWEAWHNGIWPSVYIIDKHGRVRFWWYGELDWQGAGNQKVAERQIEQLLVEE